MHHAIKLEQAVTPEAQDALAREVLASVEARLDHLSPEVAARVLDRLVDGAAAADA